MKIGTYELSATKPATMGIVNVTSDSFSDGGKFLDPSDAIEHALRLVEDGADIVDIGGESSRPGSDPVSEDEELSRVIPVIEGLRRRSGVPISIDTTKSIVAGRAIEAGADMINDISAGRFDSEMFSVAAASARPICLMHMKGTPKTMQDSPQYNDIVAEIRDFLSEAIERAVLAGVDRQNIVIDPGIGFGKTAEDNIVILKNIRRFAALGCPVLLGASRKSFIGTKLGLEVQERLEATLATVPISADGGASILRVHDVKSVRRFLEMYVLLKPVEA